MFYRSNQFCCKVYTFMYAFKMSCSRRYLSYLAYLTLMSIGLYPEGVQGKAPLWKADGLLPLWRWQHWFHGRRTASPNHIVSVGFNVFVIWTLLYFLYVHVYQVACMQFINIVVHSVEDMNFRVHLQFEFTKLGLDDFLEVRTRFGEFWTSAIKLMRFELLFDILNK